MRRYDRHSKSSGRSRWSARYGMALGAAALVVGVLSGVSSGVAQAGSVSGTGTVVGLSDPTAGHPYRHGAIPHTVKGAVQGAATTGHFAKPGYPTTGPLQYNGGPVVTGPPKIYLVFWGSQWGAESTSGGYQVFSGDPDGLAQYAQAFYAGLGTNNETWSAIATQYCQGIAIGATTCPLSPAANRVAFPASGSVLAGVWEDTSYTPPTGPPGNSSTPGATGLMLAQEAANAATYFNDSSINAQYIILSPTGTNPDGWLDPTQGYCAYHDNTQDSYWNGGVTGPNVAYTNMPYSPDAGSGYCSSFANPGILDGVGENASHEYAETLTDPYPTSGWVDAKGNEIADKCDYLLATQPGAAIYLPLSTGSFDVQGIWANDANRGHGGCETAQAPVFVTPVLKQTSYLDQPITAVQISALDPVPGAVLSYTALGLPGGLSVDSVTGLISGVPTAAGSSTVTVNVGDGVFSSAISFVWSIKPIPTTTGLTLTSPIALGSEGAANFVITVQSISGLTPGGTVKVLAGTKKVCTATLDGSGVGTCTLTASQLIAGTYSVTASYIGAGGFKSSKSTAGSLVVSA